MNRIEGNFNVHDNAVDLTVGNNKKPRIQGREVQKGKSTEGGKVRKIVSSIAPLPVVMSSCTQKPSNLSPLKKTPQQDEGTEKSESTKSSKRTDEERSCNQSLPKKSKKAPLQESENA